MKSGMLIASVFLLACAGAVGLATASPIIGPGTIAAVRLSKSIDSVPANSRPASLEALIEANGVKADKPSYINSIWTEQRVSPNELQAGFGTSVVFDSAGTTALISAPATNAGAPGSVLVFTNAGGSWTQSQTLVASDGAPNDQFGYVVAMSGSTAVITSIPTDGNGNFLGAGAAYVFILSNGNWVEQQKITASDGVAGDWFGNAVAIDGSTLVVGAYTATIGANAAQGAAYIFSDQGGNWTQTQKLTATEGVANDIFGAAVAVHDTTLVVGSYETVSGHYQGGAAYVFSQSGGTWEQVQKLTNADEVSNRASFGSAFALDDDTLLVGANFQSIDAVQTGAVYVFSKTDGSWIRTQVLSPNDGVFYGLFGISLALDGNRVLIGAPQPFDPVSGKAYVFTAVDGVWAQTQELIPSDGFYQNLFGWSAALRGPIALVGTQVSPYAYFFTEIPAPPVANIAQDPLAFDLTSGANGSTTLTIGNAGEADLTWAISESPAGASPGHIDLGSAVYPRAANSSTYRGFSAVSSSGTMADCDMAPWAPRTVEGDLSFILDDGSYNDMVSWNDGVVEFAAIYLNRFSPPAGTGPFTVDSIIIGWPTNANGSLVGKQVNLLAYYDADADGDPSNAVRLGGDSLITIESLDTFIPYTVNFSVPGAGDIYIGFESSYAIGSSTPILYPAALDTTSSQGRSWAIASQTGSGPNADDLGDNEVVSTVDSLGFPGNWMIRATGTGGAGCSNPSDVPWLSETPANGTVAGGASQDVVVTANAAGLSPGTYSAVLCVTTNDLANSLVQVPVSLTVTGDVGDAIFKDGFDGTP